MTIPGIDYYALQIYTADDVMMQPWIHETLSLAQRAAKKAIQRGAFKVEIFGYKPDGSLYHAEPVRVHFGAGAGLADHVARMQPRPLQGRNP